MTKDQKLKRRLDSLASFMDESIRLPGGYRVGWDGIIGLIPWIGDIAGLLISSYLIHGAARLGASKSLLLRMSANVAIETAIGSIPVLGDFFDFVFKSNRRNFALLEKHIARPDRTRRISNLWLFGLALALLLVILTIIFFVFRLIAWAWGLVF